MSDHKFDPKKLQKLNDPQRLTDIPPKYIYGKLATSKADVLVDIGAGTAFFSTAFFDLFHPEVLYACDLSDLMLDWIKENIAPDYPGIHPVKTKESGIPLDDGIADVAFMIALHHELNDPAIMLAEAFRILKAGGEIFIVDWKKQDMSQGPPLKIRYLPEQVQKQLLDAGFRDVAIYHEMPKHFLVVARKS